MSYSSGEAAEQVVRMTLNGVEVAAKISGKAAERLAVLLYAVLKDQKKTRGKTRLNSMLRSGKELKVFAIGDRDLEKFCREAKKYGILYCVLKDKTANDGHTDVILYLCGIIPVVWLGLLIAPCLKDGLPGLVQQFGSVMQNPFQIQLCEDRPL